MPSTKRYLALAVLPALLVAGCSNGSSSKASSSSSSSKTSSSTTLAKAATNGNLDDVSVDTTKHSVTIPKNKLPFGTPDVRTKTLTQGTGDTIGAKDLVNVDYTMVNGTNGKQALTSFGKVVGRVDMSDTSSTLPGLVSALKGARVGSKLLVSVPASKGFGAAGASPIGIGSNDDIVLYLEIKSAAAPYDQATGTNLGATSGFPQVTVPSGKGKQASITIPSGLKPPSKTESETLIQGSGDKIVAGETISVSYTGQIWNGKVFDATAKHGGQPSKFPIGIGSVIPGWDKTLVGKHVGDRVVIVVPPSDGYGSAGSPQVGIKGTDTLVFVVDILADYGYVPQTGSN